MFSKILINEKDSDFALSMVDILNTILLTSSELFDLRNALKDFNTQVCKFVYYLEALNNSKSNFSLLKN
jgi:hypothetical protein